MGACLSSANPQPLKPTGSATETITPQTTYHVAVHAQRTPRQSMPEKEGFECTRT